MTCTARRLLAAASLAVLAAAPLHAGVTLVEITATRPATAAPGALPYEIVEGFFSGELDPADPHNAVITDLALAPRNGRGKVDYRATFRLARPVDPAKASGVLVYDVPNRGMGGVAADADGHVRVISGWQGDIPPNRALQSLAVPTARAADGSSITGPVLARFEKIAADARSVPILAGLIGGTPRPLPVSLDTARASLLIETRDRRRVAVPAADWAFADCREAPFPGKPDGTRLCLRSAFDPQARYVLTYQGKDPLVLGIGFAATRDFVSFLRSGAPDGAGQANPAGSAIRWAVGFGNSQSGNFLRSFVNLGFNADERGARVFDGINPNIAARQVPLNLRFGVPGGAAGAYEAGSEGTLWWSRYTDAARGLGKTSLLDRCAASQTCPKIVETFGSAEFWGLRASPGLVGTDARADIPLPANVRRYYFPSITHGGARSKGFSANGDPTMGTCLLRGNPIISDPYLRAAQRMLIAWVRDGAEPPASRYPTLAAGDLVRPSARALGWPSIPGAPLPDGHLNPLPVQRFGKGFIRRDVSGVQGLLPPRLGRIIPQLVPRLNQDGNETAGVPSAQLLVPIGTYTGWNKETKGIDAGRNCGFEGGFIPFARTRAEREAKGDPRLSLEERYGDHAGFIARLRAVTAEQVREGWLSQADADAMLRNAEESDILR